MTELHHYYHVFAGGAWQEPVEEHYSALAKIGFDAPMTVGVIGRPEERAEAVERIYRLRRPKRVIQADKGWEQLTLRAAWANARKRPEGLTLYCHTKGAGRPERLQDAWRRSMTCALLAGVHAGGLDPVSSSHDMTGLEAHCQTLAMPGLFDLVCCHWLTAENYPDVVADTPFPMVGGNFFLARNDFLATLPPVPNRARHDAEAWIGLGPRHPRVLDLNPGWPGTVPWVVKQGWPQ